MNSQFELCSSRGTGISRDCRRVLGRSEVERDNSCSLSQSVACPKKISQHVSTQKTDLRLKSTSERRINVHTSEGEVLEFADVTAVTSEASDVSFECDDFVALVSVLRASCSRVVANDLSTCEHNSVVCARILSSSNN